MFYYLLWFFIRYDYYLLFFIVLYHLKYHETVSTARLFRKTRHVLGRPLDERHIHFVTCWGSGSRYYPRAWSSHRAGDLKYCIGLDSWLCWKSLDSFCLMLHFSKQRQIIAMAFATLLEVFGVFTLKTSEILEKKAHECHQRAFDLLIEKYSQR